MSIITYSDKSPERRQDVRFVGAIKGCYTLSSRAKAKNGKGSVFACRTVCISPKAVDILAPVRGEIGETVRLKLDDLNIISGKIIRIKSNGFVINIVATDRDREKLAARIDWIKKRMFRTVRDNRKHKRRMLPNPRTGITLEDGSTIECFVIDTSLSGAAVSADIQPEIGTRLALGGVIGVVRRSLEVGFVIKFEKELNPKDPETVFAWPPNGLQDNFGVKETPETERNNEHHL